MNAAWISLGALVLVIVASSQERFNVGILAIVLAGLIGLLMADMTPVEMVGLFPWSLFVILFGVTFFFNLAKINGTLDYMTGLMVRAARGNALVLPVNIFFFAVVLSLIGPGNIGAVALLAPLVMPLAGKVGIRSIFMTVILVTGANAGTFSPFAPTGIIVNSLTSRFGLQMDPWTQIFFPAMIAQVFLGLVCYLILVVRIRRNPGAIRFDTADIHGASGSLSGQQIATLGAIGLLILSVIVFRLDIGMAALGLGAVLMLCGVSKGETAVKMVPWSVIIMVCGVSTLVGVIEKTGGLDLFTDFLVKVSTPTSVTGMIALLTGIISSFSSSSGVVLPAFIPIVPDLVEKMGSADPVAIVASINVGSHLVDISPLSTLGAICIANAAAGENKSKLFRHLIVLGLFMAIVGGGVCHLFFGLLARWIPFL